MGDKNVFRQYDDYYHYWALDVEPLNGYKDTKKNKSITVCCKFVRPVCWQYAIEPSSKCRWKSANRTWKIDFSANGRNGRTIRILLRWPICIYIIRRYLILSIYQSIIRLFFGVRRSRYGRSSDTNFFFFYRRT